MRCQDRCALTRKRTLAATSFSIEGSQYHYDILSSQMDRFSMCHIPYPKLPACECMHVAFWGQDIREIKQHVHGKRLTKICALPKVEETRLI